MTEATELQRSVDRLIVSLDELRKELVRKDVYDSDQRGIEARFGNVETDVGDLEGKIDKAEERRAADRRLILTSLALPILVFLIQLYVTAQAGSGQ